MSFSAPALSSSYVETNGVKLHVMSAGSGPLVVFLHGFPEFWFAWRNIAPRLAAVGFRVAAVDLRGYNLSDKPTGVKS
ncbi:MAG TPA: alpha/beta fold hydrolase, partial [Polyangiaceae bacterium]